LYLPDFTIFNKNKSPANIPTFQNGGGGLFGWDPKKRTKIISKCRGTKNPTLFLSSELHNFHQN
jgi:hypothetical protein